MQNKFSFAKAAVLVGAALLSSQASAAGFQLNAQSATGIGRAFAGDAVIADNASVMARNPAAMALFDETSLSLGFESITSQIEVKDAKYSHCEKKSGGPGAPLQSVLACVNGDKLTKNSNYGDAGDTSIAPNIHLIVPINEKFAIGANVYSNFGTKTEFDDSFAGSEFGGLTDVMSINFGIAGSYRLNEQWSFGAGLDLIYGEGTLRRDLSPELEELNDQLDLLDTTNAMNAKADGWGLGFNLGTVYELDNNNRFGLAYHYSPEIEAEGEVSYLGTGYDPLYMPLPDMLEFSGYHRIEDTKFAVHYSVQYIGWSAFDVLKSSGSAGEQDLREYKWQDGMHYSIGGTYYLSNDWTLRAGYMYDTSAQDELTSVSVPDSDRQWFSAGFTYHINKKSNIDFGFTYLMGKEVKVDESYELELDPGTGPIPVEISNMKATTRANAILMGLQYSRSF